MNRKSMMILGASILQLPAILKAKEMGLRVIAVDIDKNAVGSKEADVFLEISTNDISRVTEAAKAFEIDGIMTLASDMPMRTVAAVARELRLVGINDDTALKATNKAVMREALRQKNVPIPLFFSVNNISEYFDAIAGFKCRFIVKPADNSGSRGVFLVSDILDKEMALYAFEHSKKSSRSGVIVVEEYMEGPEVSVETLSVDAQVHVIAITDKLTTGAPMFVEMGHSQPSSLSVEIKERIKEVTMAAVKALGIENGPAHTEIIVTDEGPKIVEIGARLGGDNITTHLVPLSTGLDMVKCCIDIALGNKPDITLEIDKGSAVRYFEPSNGNIVSINGIEEALELSGVIQISFVKNIGDFVGKISSSSDRIGFVIAQGANAEMAINNCQNALDRITVSVE